MALVAGILGSHITTIVSALLILGLSPFFWAEHHRYADGRHRKAVLERKVVLLNQTKNIQARKKQAIIRVNRFVDQAASSALDRKQWASYKIDIQKPVTPAEAAEMITRCSHGGSHYFQPVSCHIKWLNRTVGQKDGQGRGPAGAESPERGNKPILLTLKGAFWVRLQ